MSEWIDINEREPVKLTTVDIKLGNGSVLIDVERTFTGDYIWDFMFGEINEDHVIAWRPNVELPKEGEE